MLLKIFDFKIRFFFRLNLISYKASATSQKGALLQFQKISIWVNIYKNFD